MCKCLVVILLLAPFERWALEVPTFNLATPTVMQACGSNPANQCWYVLNPGGVISE